MELFHTSAPPLISQENTPVGMMAAALRLLPSLQADITTSKVGYQFPQK